MNTDEKVLDTSWKKRTRIVDGTKAVEFRRRVVCEGIGVIVGTPDGSRREDVEFVMSVWESSSNRWQWLARRTDGFGERVLGYACASKAIAKREAMLAGHGLAKALANRHGLPARFAVWPPWPDPKPPRRMQWPPNNVPIGETVVRLIVDAIEQTHKVRRIKGSRSNYLGIDNVRASIADEAHRTNVVDSIARQERNSPKRTLIGDWVSLAFLIGMEQGARLAQEEDALVVAVRRNPEAMDRLRRQFERKRSTTNDEGKER